MRRGADLALALWCCSATLLGAAGCAFAQGAVYRLDRASTDGAGGGVSEGPNYRLVLAIGQHDAGAVSAGGVYAYAGGVFAQLPSDTLFKDGFEPE